MFEGFTAVQKIMITEQCLIRTSDLLRLFSLFLLCYHKRHANKNSVIKRLTLVHDVRLK